MQRALSFTHSPPLSVPLRFLLNAPLFALLAALLLLWAGPEALRSRWTPYALALTHLLTLGVLGSAMAGAMMQILPVATGIHVLKPRLTAVVVHALLTAGTVALALAFLLSRPVMFGIALVLLAAAFGWLLTATALGLWHYRKQRTKGASEILVAVRLALISLLVTAALGVTLATIWAFGLTYPVLPLTDLHGAWGLSGWVGLLLIGMAYQLMPIFQVTEIYPRPVTRWLTLAIFVLLLVYTAGMLSLDGNARLFGHAASLLLSGAYLAFAALTFWLLWTRKRPQADTTTLFWRTAMACLAACGPVWVLHSGGHAELSVLLGTLFIVGVAWSAINGMLYKIMPFLLWYNAQRDLTVALRAVPKVKDIIPDPVAKRQYWAHLTGLILLLLASVRPSEFTVPAALCLGVSAAWLGFNIAIALRLYLRARTRIAAELAAIGKAPSATR
ncbi:MAG TPA: hypothetical protein VNQ97_02590 [Burkholderiaceae bacterium]|nr:hypothetical protein [Burkholderiaceae bacterium]